MAYRRGRRVPVAPQARAVARVETLPAPIGGWWTNSNLAQSNQLTARICENWLPTETGVRIRGGSLRFATIGSSAVTSMFSYVAPGLSKLFAANATEIHDVTTPADPEVAGTPLVSSRTSGHHSAAQIATAGGDFLVVCNGDDDPQVYNGSAFSNLSTFGGGVTFPGGDSTTVSDFIFPFVHQSRLWFVKKDSLDIYFMPVLSVAGAASLLTLKSQVKKGGAILFAASWSLDSGAGADDRLAVVTTEGEVVIYTGSDPASPFNFSKIGVYEIGRPLGANAWMRVGGDLIIATEDGAIPLTQVIQRDPASLELSAVSRPIEPDWRRQYLARDARPWVVLKWPARGLGLFGLPHTQGAEAFAVNLETSAWGQITGWDMQSAAVLGDRAFFGDNAGRIFEMERTGRDGTGVYFSRLQLQVNHLGQVGAAKALKLARATFRSSAPVNVQVSAAVDYAEAFPSAPAAASTEGTPAVFGIGVFGESVFGDDGSGESGGSQPTQDTGWVPVAGYGSAASMQVQVSNGDARRPDGELILLELMYQPGGFLG